jgi:hypothetical protein
MENLILAILIYVAIVAIAHCPNKSAATTDPVTAPVDYFPEVEEVAPQPATPAKTKATIANLIKEEVARPAIAATALSPIAPMSTAQPEPVQSFTVAPDLSRLGVRDLYKLASKAGIKGYKKLSKGALIQALA